MPTTSASSVTSWPTHSLHDSMSTSSGMLASQQVLTEIPQQACLTHFGNASLASSMLLSSTQGGLHSAMPHATPIASYL